MEVLHMRFLDEGIALYSSFYHRDSRMLFIFMMMFLGLTRLVAEDGSQTSLFINERCCEYRILLHEICDNIESILYMSYIRRSRHNRPMVYSLDDVTNILFKLAAPFCEEIVGKCIVQHDRKDE